MEYEPLLTAKKKGHQSDGKNLFLKLTVCSKISYMSNLIMGYLQSEAMGFCFKMAPIIRFKHILQMLPPVFALLNRRQDAFGTGRFS